MKNNLFEIIVGTFVLLIAVFFFVFSFSKSGISTSNTYQVLAKFDNIDGIGAGSDVKISGVKIGAVESSSIDIDNYQAIVRININEDIKIPTDSSAKITSSGLLGGKYIAIEIGAEEENINSNGVILFTQSGVNLEELLGKFIFGSKDK